jgi:F420-dependent oxidoreductase-like protein
MKLGIHVARFTWPGGPPAIAEDFRRIAVAAEEAGLDRLSVMDHVWQIRVNGPPEQEMLEAYTALGFAAAVTSRIQLLTLVTGVVYRPPGLLVKQVSTLDVLSSGRAILGIGAAWNDEEARGLGLPFAPIAERFERLEETLQIVHQMWSDDDGPYDGAHYHLAETICSPRPLTSPHPPIMIGGAGEKKTLRLVAKYADACNFFAGPTSGDTVRAKLDVLAGHCTVEGTDVGRIRKTILWTAPLDPTTDAGGADFAEQLRQYADLGIVEVHLMPFQDPVGFIRAVGEHVVPAVSRL